MDCIERAYLTEQFENLLHDDNVMNPVIKVLDALEVIDTAPTADVEEVKHGHFIEIKGEKEILGTLTCSCCLYTYARLYPRNYCPHCGAKMEKETRKEQA